MKKVIININKKTIFILIGIILVFSGIFFIHSYNPTFSGGNPGVMGHSPDEIIVNVSGVQKSLQQAISNNDFPRPGILSCTIANSIKLGANCISLPSCYSGQVLTYNGTHFKCISDTA